MKYTTFRGLLIGAGVLIALGAFGSCIVCVSSGSRTDSGRQAAAPSPARPAPEPRAAEPITTPPTTATAPAVELGAESLPLTEMDRAVLERARQDISGDKVKDALGGRPYKVNLYKDAGQARVNRLKIDLDRDEKWDEKWTLESADQVKRQIAPNDDEQYTLEYRLEGERWRKKK